MIGLTGRRSAGKDSTFGFIEKRAVERGLLALRRGFADRLKLSAYRIFYPGCTLEAALRYADEDKNDEFCSVSIGHYSNPLDISARTFLQRYGTEAHRDVFGNDFWVKALLPYDDHLGYHLWYDNFPDADIAVITDVRFENEAQRIQDLGGQVWEILRFEDEPDGHASEQRISPDLIDIEVPNYGSLDDLELSVRKTLNPLLSEVIA